MIATKTPKLRATDGELLFRFTRDGSNSAFRELVDRHARLVAGICRRVLRHEQDVEDAFQATFLVLVRRADQLRKRDSVAAWLFRVAHRIALNAAERRRRAPNVEVEPAATDGSPADVADREEFEILAVELERLPESYRLPLILHYLEGRSRADTAELLDSTEASVKARLARGRRMLRRRLMRRGVALSVAFAALTTPSTGWAALVDGALAATVPLPGTAGLAASPETIELARGLTNMAAPSFKLSSLVGTTVAASLLVIAGVALSQPPASPFGRNPFGDAGTSDLDSTTADPFGSSEGETEAAVTVDPATPSHDHEHGGTARAVTVTVDAEHTHGEAGAIAGNVIGPVPPIERPVELHLEATPLEDVLEFFSKHGLNIVFDDRAFDDLGLDPEVIRRQSISLDLSGVSAGSALRLVLEPRDLATREDESGEVLIVGPSPAVLRELKWSRMPTDLRAVKPSEERIASALSMQTQSEFVDTPLRDVVEFWASLHDIPIIIEEKALEDLGVPTDEPVNFVLSETSLESSLNIVLTRLDLTYLIEDEVMKITSRDAALARLDARTYPVGPLLDAGVLDEETMVDLLLHEDPEDATGVSAIPHGRFITIKQSPIGHRKTRKVIEQLKRAAVMAEDEADEQR